MTHELRALAAASDIYSHIGDHTSEVDWDAKVEAFAKLIAADCAGLVEDDLYTERFELGHEYHADVIRRKYGINS